MQLKKIAVKNFRLLHDIEVLLEKKTTVIVGRNNGGKTSLTEVMTRLLGNKHSTFRFEDFSFCAHKQFWDALAAFATKKSEEDVRNLLPAIEIKLTFSYDVDEPLGLMSDFIVDLTPECTEALVVIRYALMDGKLADLFADIPSPDEKIRAEYFVAMRDRTVEYFETSLFAADPNDETNRKAIDASALRALCASGFISAQRGLDDASQKDRVVIGKVLENLFSTAQANPDDADSHKTAKELEDAVKGVQEKISGDFNQKLDALLPALSIFGYPGLTDPKLLTETTLDVSQLLTGHTKVFYTGSNGIHLPEAYNGLGMRNIILILLQLREFFKLYSAMTPKPAVQVVFIEEPEVHLHPQMQEVFIRKLGEIAEVFSKEAGTLWPVQFVVSTHSSHVANETHFETIRYFHCVTDPESGTPNPLVFVGTIHAFCWSAIKSFQPALRKEIGLLPSWQERLTEVGGVGSLKIEYDLGHRRITDGVLSLHHDDVLALFVALLPLSKFQTILSAKYPFILIDEYQDTNLEVMNAIKTHILNRDGGSLIGLFGDHWQRIYDKTCGHVEHPKLVEIDKGANFRSATSIVTVLNHMRPELPQAFRDVDFIWKNEHIRLPDDIIRREDAAREWKDHEGVEIPEGVALVRSLREVPYREVVALDQFIDGHTPFATKHSVKGDEFENVLVVLGRGWNQYNFEQFLELSTNSSNVPTDKKAVYERNRNLFYACCSRSTTRLALLFTQELSDKALRQLKAWFGAGAVHDFAPS